MVLRSILKITGTRKLEVLPWVTRRAEDWAAVIAHINGNSSLAWICGLVKQRFIFKVVESQVHNELKRPKEVERSLNRMILTKKFFKIEGRGMQLGW